MNQMLKIKDIMSTNVVSFNVDTLVDEIVSIMQEKKISSVIIVEGKKPLGIITERDILKASLSADKILQRDVTTLMSSPVKVMPSHLDYRDAYMQMNEQKIRHIVVTDNKEELVGILSESNFLNHLSPDQLLAIKEVSKVMTKRVLTCKPHDSLRSVLEQMVDKKIGGIVVEDNDKAVGIISERDALKFIQESKDLLDQAVSTCMSSPVTTIHKNQTVLNAQTIMDNLGIRRLVVVDDDKVIAGIVSRHDLIKHIPEYYVEILQEMIERQKSLVSSTQVELDEKVIFQNTVKSLPHTLVLMTQKEGIIQFVNTNEKAFCSIPIIKVGDNIENLESSFFELLENDTWKDKVAHGETVHKIIKIKNKHFDSCYLHTSISAILDEKNRFNGYLYIARNISIEHTMELELQRLNDHLKEAYHIANIGNWELNAKTLNAFWSDEICDIVGMPRNSKGGPEVLKTLVKEEDFEIIESSLFSALQTGSNHELIYELHPKNSDESRWVECRARRELNEDGSPKCLIGTLQDITQRVEAQRKARENEDSMVLALESAGHGVWDFNTKDNTQYLSPQYSAMLGYENDEIDNTFQAFFDLLHPDDLIQIQTTIESFTKNKHLKGDKFNHIFRMKTKNGTYKWILSNGNVISTDDDGNIVRVIGTHTDITEQKQVEEELRLFKRSVESSNEGITITKADNDRETIYVNPAFEKLSGYSSGEILGKNLRLLNERNREQPEIELIHNAIENHESIEVALKNYRKDGSEFISKLSIDPILDETNTVTHFIGLQKDITKERQEEEKVKESENKFKGIFEQAAVGTARVSLDGTWLEVNKKLCDIVGYSKEELLTKTFQDITHPDDLEADLNYIHQLLNNEIDTYSMNKRYFKKDESIVWINLTVSLVRNPDNTPDYFISIIEDITKTKQQVLKEELLKNKLKNATKLAQFGTWEWDAINDIATWNDMAYEIFGIKRGSKVNRDFIESLIHKDDVQLHKDSITKCFKDHSEVKFEYRIIKNNEIRIIHAIGNPTVVDGKVVSISGAVQDITELRKDEYKLKEAQRIAKIGSWEQDLVKDTLKWSDEVYRIFETDISKEMMFDDFVQRVHPEDRESVFKAFQTSVKEHKSYHIVHRLLFANGRIKYVLEDAQHFYDSSDNHISTIGTVQDITILKENERQLRQSATVFENTTEGVMITNADSIILNVNEAFSQITGRKNNEVIGKKASILKSGRHNKKYYNEMWKSISDLGSWRGEIWNRRKNGEIYPQWLNISSVKNSSGLTESYIAVFSDITALKETEAQLDFLAHHDHLTELPNRILLKARLKHTLSTAKREKSMTAVMFMDLDNFKNINDSYGHTFGDELLIAISKRLGNLIREDDTFSRIGGDEFVIVMSHFTSLEQITKISQKIMEQFEEPFTIEEKEFWTSVSIGISIAPDDGNSSEILIKNADTAMYQAKEDGKSTVKFYDDKMSASSFERVVFESALKAGIQNKEFEVYYQPQEDLQKNTIIGFEALIRWHHPTLGLVPPDKFISIAEETKMILDIGAFVLEQSCKDIKKWHNEGLCKGRIAVNVSGVQLEHSDFAEILKHNLKKYNVDPSMIEIEVTESMVMKNPDRWITILQEIHRVGVSISIDDFGTGYSSLSYLRRLPVDTLKIDQSFVQDIPEEKDACAIVDAIINMADSLGLNTLAEGIETTAHRKYLVEKSCTYGQGYLLSKPMNGKDTYNWLKAKHLEK